MLKEVMCHCGATAGKPPHVDHLECDKCGSYWVTHVEYLRKRKIRIWWETPIVATVVTRREKRKTRFCPWCGEPYKANDQSHTSAIADSVHSLVVPGCDA